MILISVDGFIFCFSTFCEGNLTQQDAYIWQNHQWALWGLSRRTHIFWGENQLNTNSSVSQEVLFSYLKIKGLKWQCVDFIYNMPSWAKSVYKTYKCIAHAFACTWSASKGKTNRLRWLSQLQFWAADFKHLYSASLGDVFGAQSQNLRPGALCDK